MLPETGSTPNELTRRVTDQCVPFDEDNITVYHIRRAHDTLPCDGENLPDLGSSLIDLCQPGREP